jgi:hypothetical protein
MFETITHLVYCPYILSLAKHARVEQAVLITSAAPCSVEAMAEPHVSPTWQPPSQDEQSSGTLDAAELDELPDSAYAFPAQRKEPLTSASHVRSALSRFDQVQDVTDADRALAFENIRRAAAHYDVDMTEHSWHDLMH